jgi:transposase
MRASTAFNRILQLPGATVSSVQFTDEAIVVGIRARQRQLCCPSCGYRCSGRYDQSRRRWRHLDIGSCRLFLEATIRRLCCPTCGVRTETVPWARPGARHTRDFEDVITWLAQRTDRTSVSRLMRCSWEAVSAIIIRVVTDHLDQIRLDAIYRIGVDEIGYRRGHQYLTVVGDHDQRQVVWVAEGRTQQALQGFFDKLGPEQTAKLQAVSMDMSTIYSEATRQAAPKATICFDPFHVIQWANRALDSAYASATSGRGSPVMTARQWKRARWALRTGKERLTDERRKLINTLRRTERRLFRAWELKEMLRDLYRDVKPAHAHRYLTAWITTAKRSNIPAFVALAGRIERHFDGIIAAVRLGLSNGLIESINAKIRLINARGYGHHSAESLAAMIYLCAGGIRVELPTPR